MIKIGDKFPKVDVTRVDNKTQETVSTDTLFSGKKVVLFAVPGAFTPTCSESHLPGYIIHADSILSKGVDMIACTSVNDAFVMQAWGKTQNAEAITLLADGGGALASALGLVLETGDFGGNRSKRYAMIIDDGIVTQINLEQPGAFEVSDAETILAAL
jgi:peroxiredoxin